MQEIFSKAAQFKTTTTQERILRVDVSGFAVAAHNRKDIDFLYTIHAADCTGLALIAPDKTAAMVHMFSNEKFIHAGEQRIKNHAREIWNEFSERLPGSEKFTVLAFGAQRSGICIEEALKWPMDLVRRAAVSECLSETFIDAALQSGRIDQFTDCRYMDSPHDAIIDRNNGDIVVGRMSDGLRTKMPHFHKLQQGENFRCAYDLLPS